MNDTVLQHGDLIPLQQMDGVINTISGKKFNLLNPTIDMVDLFDISKGLAYKPHFAGMLPQFFSIAEHSILVKDLAKKEGHNKMFLAICLLHDGAEAYIGDMIKPLKIHLPFFCEVENKIMHAIFRKFNLDFDLLKQVKKYDLKAQEIEYNCFYKGSSFRLQYLEPEPAFRSFKNELEFYINKEVRWIDMSHIEFP